MSDEEDLIVFSDDDPESETREDARRWKIVVIDDDRAVHDGTRFALYDYMLDGYGLDLVSAFSAAEGREVLQRHPDTAVVLLDVVMETESAGLELVGFIRKVMKNETVRIILRTGQPGQAPERHVIVEYDINDYKAKTELTADKLFTAITSAIRSFQQLERMKETRRGLEIIIDAATTLYDFNSMQRLARGVLTQISSLLAVDCAGILVLRHRDDKAKHFAVLAGSGCYQHFAGLEEPDDLDADIKQLIQQAFEHRETEFLAQRSVLYIHSNGGTEVVVVLEVGKKLSETDRALVEIFCGRLSIAFDNVVLYDQLQRANASLEARVVQRTAELTAANGRLEEQWQRSRQTNSLQREMVGTVAHDLKSPLSVILGRSEMIGEIAQKRDLTGDELRGQLAHIKESAKRLIDMVDKLIADAMADALDIVVRPERFDFVALVRKVSETNLPLAERKQQTLAVAADGAIEIDGDQERLRDAVDNLIGNAIKYSRIGGRIAISVMAESDAAIMRVTDSGPGLLPEDMDRLFGRFQRLSARPTGGEGSTGLGLSIVKRIVDLHGGAVSAHSHGPDQGSSFIMRLVRAPGGSAA